MIRLGRLGALAIVTAGLCAACSDDGGGPKDAAAGSDGSGANCGPGTAAADGLQLNTGAEMGNYQGLKGSPNGDCPATGAPAGVVSLTITGTQMGTPDIITLCIPRPDLIGSGTHSVGLDQTTADVQIVDLEAEIDSCSYEIDRTTPPTGTATATGVCANGTSTAGFALTLDANVTMTITCANGPNTVSARLMGTTAVGH